MMSGTSKDHYTAGNKSLPDRHGLLDDYGQASRARQSEDSISTTSVILERLYHGDEVEGDDDESSHAESSSRASRGLLGGSKREEYHEDDDEKDVGDNDDDHDDLELGDRLYSASKPMEGKIRKLIYVVGALLVGGWLIALGVYLVNEHYRFKVQPYDHSQTSTSRAGKSITLDQVMNGSWRQMKHTIYWVAGPYGKQDGLMLTQGGEKEWLVIEDLKDEKNTIILMKSQSFRAGEQVLYAEKVWPSPNLKLVLIAINVKRKFRHSFTAIYWIYDVENGTAFPLIPKQPEARVLLAKWSPTSDAVAFVEENNVYVRRLPEEVVTEVTRDGGIDLFYGIPDWVYEEEVFSGNEAMWWSPDGSYLSFLRTNESQVPEYPIEFFVSRPSGENPEPGLEHYPEVEEIKYPKAGAPNPVVDLQFWDMEKSDVFSVSIANDFPDNNRLITEVVWAGGQRVLVRETNRESDFLRMILIEVSTRTGKVVREFDVAGLDNGWFEVSQNTAFIPADPERGRPSDGYIDTVIHDGYDHLAYFTPMDSDTPILLTKGPWEVVSAPSAVDLDKGIVYFVATKRSPIERHVYSVRLDGTGMKAITNTSEDGRYDVSFSKKSGYALLTYNGPGIPWQRVIGTESGDPAFEKTIETNPWLANLASVYELPTFHYSVVTIDDFTLQVLERRPPHFDPKKKYPVLFFTYGGPGSQQVTKAFSIDFQAYVAASLGYIVVTVDGRGTGFIGRKARCVVRGNLGHYESRDQIETAKIWAKKSYVDDKKMAIWGWSYGGFLTLKTLEQDAGQTFSYGIAVAPVTDWKFYDSIYTERYMHTPQHNPTGYAESAISNTTALAKTVRFLVMHGVADDNVHLQNTLTLIDKLDVASVENYDVHVFPDSDHSIYFHNANRMVYDRLENWLITAFNGEFLRREGIRPTDETKTKDKSKRNENLED